MDSSVETIPFRLKSYYLRGISGAEKYKCNIIIIKSISSIYSIEMSGGRIEGYIVRLWRYLSALSAFLQDSELLMMYLP